MIKSVSAVCVGLLGWGMCAFAQTSQPTSNASTIVARIDHRVEDQQLFAQLLKLGEEKRQDEMVVLAIRLLTEHSRAIIELDKQHYESITIAVHREMAKWTKEVIALYRKRFNDDAERAFEACELVDPSCWREVADRYPLTEAAIKAEYRLKAEAAADSVLQPSRQPMSLIPPSTELFWRYEIDSSKTETAAVSDSYEVAPVVAGDYVYFQDALRLWCVNRWRGQAVWKADLSDLIGITTDKLSPATKRGPRKPLIVNDRLYAVMGKMLPAKLAWQQVEGVSALICLNSKTGQLRWQCNAADVLTVGKGGFFDGEALLYRGSLHVVMRRWPTPTEETCYLVRVNPQDGRLLSTTLLASNAVGNASHRRLTRCDPVVKNDDVFVDTGIGVLAELDPWTGKIRRLQFGMIMDGLGQRATWSDGLFTIIAEKRSVAAYSNPVDAWRLLNRRLDEHPNDTARRLDCARYGLFSGQPDDTAWAALDSVLKVDPGAAFDVVMAVVDQNNIDLDQLLIRAERAAGSHEQQVRYRLAFGKAFTRRGKPERAVTLYQQVLDDPTLQQVAIGTDRNHSGRIADHEIAALVKQHDRNIYAKYDETAALQCQQGIKTHDARLLQQVIDRYPNSLAAGKALGMLVDMDATEDQIIRFLLHHRDQPHAWSPLLIQKLADKLHASGRSFKGRSWLARGRAIYPDHSFHANAETKPSRGSDIKDKRLPMTLAWQRPTDSSTAIIAPPKDSAGDILLLHEAEQLLAFNVKTGQPLWLKPVALKDIPDCLTCNDQQVVLSTRFRILSIDAKSGQLLWAHGQRPHDADSPTIDPEYLRVIVARLADALGCVVIDDVGNARSVSLPDGELLWTRSLDVAHGKPIVMTETELAYIAKRSGEVVVVDRWNGKERHRLKPAMDSAVQWIGCSTERSVIGIGSAGALAWNLDTGTTLWGNSKLQSARLNLIQIGLTTLCVPGEDGRWRGYSVYNGNPLWATPPFSNSENDAARWAWLDRERLIVVTDNIIGGVDVANGQVEWQTDLRNSSTITECIPASGGLVLVGQDDESTVGVYRADFGEVLNRKALTAAGDAHDIRQTLLIGNSLIIRSHNQIGVWQGSDAAGR